MESSICVHHIRQELDEAKGAGKGELIGQREKRERLLHLQKQKTSQATMSVCDSMNVCV